MQKLIRRKIFLILLFACLPINSADFVLPIELTCKIFFSNYAGVKQAEITRIVVLKHLKHNANGREMISQTDDFEFWVMLHSAQTLDEKRFVNNFQVAIKEKKTGLFAHAMSDSSHSFDVKPKSARISFVEYHPESFIESGELFFKCDSF